MAHSHSHDGGTSHSHNDPLNGHGHSHEILDGPGSYVNREMPLIEGRDWKDRAFTIGIGGYVVTKRCPDYHDLDIISTLNFIELVLMNIYRPVGSGKTALMRALCLALRDEYNIAAVTNDIFTRYVYASHRALEDFNIKAMP